MEKRYIHHLWTKIRPIKVWYLVAALLVVAALTALVLRQNNLTMLQLQKEVYVADEQNGNVEAALQNLRSYVHAHMNTNLFARNDAVYPPIQLVHTYQRLKDAEKARVQEGSTAVYTDAQNFCEQQNATDFSGRNRIPCIEKYIADHPVAKERTIPDDMYKFDFYSPRWTPDSAGWGVVLTMLLGIALLLRIALQIVMKRFVK